MKKFIDKIKNKKDLSFDESKAAFELLMEGKVNDQEIFEFLLSSGIFLHCLKNFRKILK